MNLENSRLYYGKTLRSSADLKTDACSTAEAPSAQTSAALANIHPEVAARYYGCGLVAPLERLGYPVSLCATLRDVDEPQYLQIAGELL